jgi:hypothetical protein
MMGNAIGWTGFDEVTATSPEVGANTYVYAAFNPDIIGEFDHFSLERKINH